MILYEDVEKHLAIRLTHACHPEFVGLLEQTLWGNKGTVYAENDIKHIIEQTTQPYCFSLEENDKIIAAAFCIKKMLKFGTNYYPAFYFARMAVQKAGAGYGTILCNTALQRMMQEFGDKGIVYGYVDAGNAPSLKVAKKTWAQPLVKYAIIVFSRLFPKNDRRVGKLKETERESVIELLNEQYADYDFLDFEQSLKSDEYYVLRSENNEILAGVQAQIHHWRFKQIPGFIGKLAFNVFPYLPILNRFDPRNLHFLDLGNIYLLREHETEIFKLMESALAQTGTNIGFISIDTNSPVYKRMKTSGNFGLLNIGTPAQAHLLAKFKGFAQEELNDIQQHPLFIPL